MCEAPWIFPSRILRSSKADLGCTSRSLNLLAIDPISTKPPYYQKYFSPNQEITLSKNPYDTRCICDFIRLLAKPSNLS